MSNEVLNGENPTDDDELLPEEPLADEDLLQEMVMAIVEESESVTVEVRREGIQKVLVVRTAPHDCGKVIGKLGRMADLFRNFFHAVGSRNGYPIAVIIMGKDGNYVAPPPFVPKPAFKPGNKFKPRSFPKKFA